MYVPLIRYNVEKDFNSLIFYKSSFNDSHAKRSKLVRDVNLDKHLGSNFNDVHPLKFNVERYFNSLIFSESSFNDSHVERFKLVRDVNSNKCFGSNFIDHVYPLRSN